MADSFVFYRSFAENIAKIPDPDTQFKFYKAIIDFGLDDVKTDFEYPLDLFFEQMCISISAAKSKHEKRVAAGKKGGKKSKGGGAPQLNKNAKKQGAPTKNGNAIIKTTSKQQAKTSKQQANVNGNDNFNEVITINMDNDLPPACAPLNAAQPSAIWEVVTDEDGKPRFIKHEHGGNGET